MNKIKLILCLLTLNCFNVAHSQALTSGMADGNSSHTSSGSSAVSAYSGGSSSYSNSRSSPAKARPQEAFAYQLQQAKEIAIAINARRMQKIKSQMQFIQFNNPFNDAEPQNGFTDWNKEKSKFDNNAINEDYSTLSSKANNIYKYPSGYINYNSLTTKMTPSVKVAFTETELETNSRKDIQKEYLTEVADKTIDKTIDEIEDEGVKSRLKSIKEIHNETYDLFEKMIDDFFKPYPKEMQDRIDNFFKPYPPDVQERIDRFFGNYKGKVLVSFAKANSHIREKIEQMDNYAPIGEIVFDKYNSLRP